MYKFETHCHTSETSRCSRIDGASLAAFYHSLGYAGMYVTDHFFNGNTTVPRSLPWEERVDMFVAGYENASSEGAKYGMKVFFGWEYTYRGADFLTYGLNKDWLLAHPELSDWSVEEYLDHARADGAFIVHAHPFREAGYIPRITLEPRRVDAVEVINTSMPPEFNSRAEWYAESYGLKRMYGSDNHVGAREWLGGAAFASLPENADEYVNMLREDKYTLFDDKYQL